MGTTYQCFPALMIGIQFGLPLRTFDHLAAPPGAAAYIVVWSSICYCPSHPSDCGSVIAVCTVTILFVTPIVEQAHQILDSLLVLAVQAHWTGQAWGLGGR